LGAFEHPVILLRAQPCNAFIRVPVNLGTHKISLQAFLTQMFPQSETCVLSSCDLYKETKFSGYFIVDFYNTKITGEGYIGAILEYPATSLHISQRFKEQNKDPFKFSEMQISGRVF